MESYLTEQSKTAKKEKFNKLQGYTTTQPYQLILTFIDFIKQVTAISDKLNDTYRRIILKSGPLKKLSDTEKETVLNILFETLLPLDDEDKELSLQDLMWALINTWKKGVKFNSFDERAIKVLNSGEESEKFKAFKVINQISIESKYKASAKVNEAVEAYLAHVFSAGEFKDKKRILMEILDSKRNIQCVYKNFEDALQIITELMMSSDEELADYLYLLQDLIMDCEPPLKTRLGILFEKSMQWALHLKQFPTGGVAIDSMLPCVNMAALALSKMPKKDFKEDDIRKILDVIRETITSFIEKELGDSSAVVKNPRILDTFFHVRRTLSDIIDKLKVVHREDLLESYMNEFSLDQDSQKLVFVILVSGIVKYNDPSPGSDGVIDNKEEAWPNAKEMITKLAMKTVEVAESEVPLIKYCAMKTLEDVSKHIGKEEYLDFAEEAINAVSKSFESAEVNLSRKSLLVTKRILRQLEKYELDMELLSKDQGNQIIENSKELMNQTTKEANRLKELVLLIVKAVPGVDTAILVEIAEILQNNIKTHLDKQAHEEAASDLVIFCGILAASQDSINVNEKKEFVLTSIVKILHLLFKKMTYDVSTDPLKACQAAFRLYPEILALESPDILQLTLKAVDKFIAEFGGDEGDAEEIKDKPQKDLKNLMAAAEQLVTEEKAKKNPKKIPDDQGSDGESDYEDEASYDSMGYNDDESFFEEPCQAIVDILPGLLEAELLSSKMEAFLKKMSTIIRSMLSLDLIGYDEANLNSVLQTQTKALKKLSVLDQTDSGMRESQCFNKFMDEFSKYISRQVVVHKSGLPFLRIYSSYIEANLTRINTESRKEIEKVFHGLYEAAGNYQKEGKKKPKEESKGESGDEEEKKGDAPTKVTGEDNSDETNEELAKDFLLAIAPLVGLICRMDPDAGGKFINKIAHKKLGRSFKLGKLPNIAFGLSGLTEVFLSLPSTLIPPEVNALAQKYYDCSTNESLVIKRLCASGFGAFAQNNPPVFQKVAKICINRLQEFLLFQTGDDERELSALREACVCSLSRIILTHRVEMPEDLLRPWLEGFPIKRDQKERAIQNELFVKIMLSEEHRAFILGDGNKNLNNVKETIQRILLLVDCSKTVCSQLEEIRNLLPK